MLTLSVAEILPILQTAIGPTILISGVGLLLLTMTNRLGRVIDRYRVLLKELQNASPENRARYDIQLKILWRRAKLVRLAIALAAASELFAAVLIIVIFSVAVTHVEITWLIGSLFIAGMLCLISAMIAFLWDINLSVASFKHEFDAPHMR
jgi:hypothetical protein